jgi:hypothetical protein
MPSESMWMAFPRPDLVARLGVETAVISSATFLVCGQVESVWG